MTAITSHVLDTALGKPARGLRVSLAQRDAQGGFVTVAERVTDDNGRIKEFLAGARLLPGTYRLRFESGDYLVATHGSHFYPVIDVVFAVVSGEEHYHVPLLLSPYGYSTYRGS